MAQSLGLDLQISNDAMPDALQNCKTVECRLKKTYEKLAETEANVQLFIKLKSMGMATNDVANFAKKQTIHKRVNMCPDVRVLKAAMQSKLVDAIAYAKRLRRQRDMDKRKLSGLYSSNKTKGRRVLECLFKHYKSYREDEMRKMRAKIEHYIARDQIRKATKSAPEVTREYLSDVNVFSADQTNVQPQPPALPFICHKDIKLSEYEVLLLSKGPGFMVREDLDKEIFEVETEKMVAKKKFDSAFKESKDDCAATAVDTQQVPQNTQNQPPSTAPNLGKSLQGSGENKSELISNTNNLWESYSGKMVYDMKSKSLDFGNLSAPKYKYNKRICMPDPESPELEVCHELRRTEMNRIFNRFINDGQKTKKYLKGTQSHENSNLTREELIGLKSLKQRIKSGEIIICETDKSRKFAALTPAQYLESGLQHTTKDLQIEPERVKRIQNVVNSHVEWLKEITNIGKNVGHESRMSNNLSDKGEQVCNMSLLLKDHKKWVCGSVGPIPSRPVISGNNGLNCHLSELVSAIVDPVASELEGREIDSTDDMLSKIDELNVKLNEGIEV